MEPDCQEKLSKELESDIITHGQEPQIQDGCIFCKIVQGTEKATILFQNSEVTVFYDMRPASKEHLLIIPNCHRGNPKSLKKQDIPMVEYLHKVGKSILETKGATMENTRSGFHWPPFNTVQHLHLHMIYPENEMGMTARLQYKLNSMWFVTYDWLLDRLKNLPGELPPTPPENATNTQEEKETTEES